MSSLEEAFAHSRAAFGKIPSSVIQVGAHEGQERWLYKTLGVIAAAFIEPNKRVFDRLQSNIAGFDNFHAVNAVCTSEEGEEVLFNVANNEESSSTLPLGRHASMFPDIIYTESFKMKGRSLDGLLKEELKLIKPETLVIDTQGSELNVLKGAPKFLEDCQVIFSEVSETPLYEGGCTLKEMMTYLGQFGFEVKWLKMSRWKTGDALFLKD